MLKPAVLQFGTGRFLLAHVDLFVSEALADVPADFKNLLDPARGVVKAIVEC